MTTTLCDTTSIDVASLADYNNGNLHGRWIDADQDPEDISAEIAEMLKTSKMPLAEEWAIHDHEGFGGFQLSEFESMETVSSLAKGIAEHGIAFAKWAQYIGTTEMFEFEDHYLGSWGSISEYAEEMVPEGSIPEWISPYVDYAAYAEGLCSDLFVVEEFECVHLFQP